MTQFNGVWYKNGPLKTKHPLLGTGNIVKLTFQKGKLVNYRQKQIEIPQIQQFAPTFDKKGFFFKNEGNISVVPYKNNILGLSECMPPYQFDSNLNQKFSPFLPPSSVHPKVINNQYWNSYIYGKFLIVTCEQSIIYFYELDRSYYTHDFYMDDNYMFWFISPIVTDIQKSVFDGIIFKSPTKMLTLNRKNKIFDIIDLPSEIQNKPIFHIGNVSKTNHNNYRIGIFSNKIKSFNEIKHPFNYTSIPSSILYNTSFQKTYLLQHHPSSYGDMPKVYNEKTIFITKNILRVWNKDNIKSRVFDCLLEEPVWTHEGTILLLGHYESHSCLFILDDNLDIISSINLPDKLNYSFHGFWVPLNQ